MSFPKSTIEFVSSYMMNNTMVDKLLKSIGSEKSFVGAMQNVSFDQCRLKAQFDGVATNNSTKQSGICTCTFVSSSLSLVGRFRSTVLAFRVHSSVTISFRSRNSRRKCSKRNPVKMEKVHSVNGRFRSSC